MRKFSGERLLIWRKEQIALGGRTADLDWLLDLAAGLRWSELQKIFLEPSREISLQSSLEELSVIWAKHLQTQTPLQYLLGICPWRDFELEVSTKVLIPRQETELLVDIALKRVEGLELGKWVDLGTGSGAIAVALARSLLSWEGEIVDCSLEALLLAKKNLDHLAPEAHFQIHRGNWWEAVNHSWGKISLAVVNPPYIPSPILPSLEPIVRDHEPHLALSGGEDGLFHIRQIVEGATQALKKNGWLILEHHHDQSDSVLNLMQNSGLQEVEYGLDLNGVKRFAIGRNF